MYGFSSKVQGLLQLLKESEREEAMAKLDPNVAKRLKERRNKERPAGSGGLNPEMDQKIGHRRSGVPEAQDMGKAMLESSGRYYLQNNPVEVRYSEEDYEDFTTCQRPDGSKYGTGGQCRKGKETTPGSEEKPKKHTPKQIAAAEAKLAKLKKKSDEANAERKLTYQAIAGAGAGMARGPGLAKAQAPARRRAERAATKATEASEAYRAQKKLVNEMKGIKEEAPKPKPKTASQTKQEKRRQLEAKINKRGADIAKKYGRDSDRYKKFVAKYGPTLRKLQDEMRANMFA